jgi:hypothetical protein
MSCDGIVDLCTVLSKSTVGYINNNIGGYGSLKTSANSENKSVGHTSVCALEIVIFIMLHSYTLYGNDSDISHITTQAPSTTHQ